MSSVRRSLPPAVPLKLQWRPSDWPNASLYCLVARAVHLNPSISGGLPDLYDFTTRNSEPLRCMKGQGSSLVRHLLEQEVDIDHRLGRDLTSHVRGAPMLEELRYCPECLRVGYHSTMFQYLGLQNCPTHRCLLQVGCGGCGRGVVPTLHNVVADPFACPKCRKCFVSSVAAVRDEGALKALDRRLGDMRSLLSKSVEAKRQCKHPTIFGPAECAKAVRRFTSWHGSHVWGAFREECQVEGSAPPRWEVNVEAGTFAALNALHKLFQDCSEFWLEADTLRTRVALSGSGVRLEGSASAVAAALCKTGCVLRASGFLLDPNIPLHSSDAQQRLASFIDEDTVQVSPSGYARLRQLEVLALFAFHLVEASKARHLKDLTWERKRLESSFVAAWCRQRDTDGTLYLRIRPRIDETGVARLIRRYRAHILKSDLNAEGVAGGVGQQL